jgi:DNA topoisomerase III
VIENRKGYSCWSKDDPGCGFVIWKEKAGKTLPPSVVKELMATGRTEKPVPGFRGRSGRTFKAKLKLLQTDAGKWRVDFDEEWAQQPRDPEAPAAAEGGNGASADAAERQDGTGPARSARGRRRKTTAAKD